MKAYLDNAATTPVAPEVVDIISNFLRTEFGNPSSTHSFGRKVKTQIETARRSIAKHLNCEPGEIYFTSGGTEADNLAMHIAVRDMGCTRIITSKIEHSAIVKPAEKLEEEGKVSLHWVALTEDGSIDLNDLKNTLSDGVKTYVTLMHGNNEIANILPLQEVAEMCVEHGALFHSDTVQTMGHYRFNLKETPIHFLNAAAHKYHGPKGVGFIFIRKNIPGFADITGGAQERGMRGGTENTASIMGMAKAMDIAFSEVEEHRAHVSELKQYMIAALKKRIPGIVFNGQSESTDSLYTVLSTTFPPTKNNDMFLFLLDLEGIAASGGSACSSGATKGSYVLDGIDALREGQPAVRFSFSRYTTKEEIDYAVEKATEIFEAGQI
jgi:cysteine desulfurase